MRVKAAGCHDAAAPCEATLPNGQQVKDQLPPSSASALTGARVDDGGTSPLHRIRASNVPQGARWRNLHEVQMKAVRLTVPATIPACKTLENNKDRIAQRRRRRSRAADAARRAADQKICCRVKAAGRHGGQKKCRRRCRTANR